MSKGFWRTGKPTEPFSPGKCATERVSAYIKTWQGRCYSGGIPEEVPKKVADSLRAPSWKAVALCLLQNDLRLYGLGYAAPAWEEQRRTLAKVSLALHGANPARHQLELPL
jgi:predicted phosphoadenosine phosphosulfate sulfurtransferase